MKKIYGIAVVTLLLAMTAFASQHEYVDSQGCDYAETFDHDTLVAVDEDITQYSPLGESSALLYQGKQFKVKTPDGAEFEYQVNDDGVSVTLTKGTANGTSTLVIPSSVESFGSYFFVSEINQFAFKNFEFSDNTPMKGVKHLIISEGIISAGQNTFDSSPDLEVVELPSSLEIIPYGMFNNCNKLKEIRIPANSRICNIESFAFDGCSALENFNIPSEVSQIGEGPGRGCTSLEKLDIQEGNYNYIVNEGVLYKGWQGDLIQYPAGKRDKSYQILYGTKSICNSAFYGNPYIEFVHIPASVDSISHIAFFDCKSLSTVIFNDAIQFIGNKAFGECPNLYKITLYGSPQYTNEPNDIYNTFSRTTNVTVQSNIPEIEFPRAKGGILMSVLDYISNFKGFHSGGIEKNEDYGFPDFYGRGKWTVYGNAGPKKDVLNVLEKIPSNLLKLENIDDKGCITRLYLDKSDKKNLRVLYFFGGIGGNDLVVALFEGGNLKKIERTINEVKQGKYGK